MSVLILVEGGDFLGGGFGAGFTAVSGRGMEMTLAYLQLGGTSESTLDLLPHLVDLPLWHDLPPQ